MYKNTKIAHDIRLGYTILGKSVKNCYKVIPSWQSASHLSYILPGLSAFCSLVNKDIELDKGAILWTVVNGLQCYIFILSDSKILTISAYALDIYLGNLKDRRYLASSNSNDTCIVTRYLKNYSETAYGLLVLGNISANVFEQADIGLIFFGVSLLFKLVLLTRDQQLSTNSLFYAFILSLAPVAFLFSVESDCNLIFNLVTLTWALYLMGSSPLHSESSSQADGNMVELLDIQCVSDQVVLENNNQSSDERLNLLP